MPTMEPTDGRRRALREVRPDETTNLGLWLDRFLSQKEDAGVRAPREEDLTRIKVPAAYERALVRREEALRACDGGFVGGVTRCWTAKVEGRLIVGLGAASVRETGISLVRTWGVPLVPGSALKGVAAAMARRSGDEAWQDGGDAHHTLFGDPQRGGCVVFHDAWWIPRGAQLPLQLDVLTVHHRDYYGGGDSGPCDWDEPVPVPFVTATGEYLVALTGPERWVEAAGALLSSALTELGVGAKTAAGYGRMKLERRRTKADVDREQAAESLRSLPGRLKGPQNMSQIVAELETAQVKGAHPDDLREAVRGLWRSNAKTVKQWLAKADRTDAQRALLDRPKD